MAEIQQILRQNNLDSLFSKNNNLDKETMKKYLDYIFQIKQANKTVHEIGKQCAKEKIHEGLRVFCPLYKTETNPLEKHIQTNKQIVQKINLKNKGFKKQKKWLKI